MVGVTNGWPDEHLLAIREGGITKSVIAVGLLENPLITNYFDSKQSERTILEDKGLAL